MCVSVVGLANDRDDPAQVQVPQGARPHHDARHPRPDVPIVRTRLSARAKMGSVLSFALILRGSFQYVPPVKFLSLGPALVPYLFINIYTNK